MFVFFDYIIFWSLVLGVKYVAGNQSRKKHETIKKWFHLTFNGYPPHNWTPRMKIDKLIFILKRGHTPYFNFNLEVEITPNIFMS